MMVVFCLQKEWVYTHNTWNSYVLHLLRENTASSQIHSILCCESIRDLKLYARPVQEEENMKYAKYAQAYFGPGLTSSRFPRRSAMPVQTAYRAPMYV